MQGARKILTMLLFNRYVLFLLIMVIYPGAVEWLGGKSIEWLTFIGSASLRLELPLVLYLYYLFNQLFNKTQWGPYLAALPILIPYVVYDIYFLMYGKSIRLIEVTELPELLDVFPLTYIVLLFVFSAILIWVFIKNINFHGLFKPSIVAIPLAALVFVLVLFPAQFVAWFHQVGHVNAWSDAENVSNNGRWAMAFYSEARRRKVNDELGHSRDRVGYIARKEQRLKELSQLITRKRNIHLIVLESFLDPAMLENVTFSQNPMHAALRPYYDKDNWSIAKVFAGGTSQSEFEVLCGVPAFAEFTAVEFNSFTGSATYCLPGLLEGLGYRTLASNAYKPNFFNTIPAYEGIGFGEIYFSKEYAKTEQTYLSTGDIKKERFMFDGRLFDLNFNYLFGADQDDNKPPTFNYVLGVYGHFPHHLNEDVRPSVVEVFSDVKDSMLRRYVSQYYYRTKALGEHIARLQKADPESLIIAISDHLPPLSRGSDSYTRLQYLGNREDSIHHNRIFIIDNGVLKNYSNMRHYDVPSIILNYLTDGAYCKAQRCDHLLAEKRSSKEDHHNAYIEVMAHATE